MAVAPAESSTDTVVTLAADLFMRPALLRNPSRRLVTNHVGRQVTYYAKAIRDHKGIENRNHRVRDGSLGEGRQLQCSVLIADTDESRPCVGWVTLLPETGARGLESYPGAKASFQSIIKITIRARVARPQRSRELTHFCSWKRTQQVRMSLWSGGLIGL